MTEFTDGTAKGKTLSLVEMEKRLEALPTSENVESMIKSAIQDLINSGDVPRAGKTSYKEVKNYLNLDVSKWNEYTIVAQENGWYFTHVTGNMSNNPSAYIKLSYNGATESRSNGNAYRDFSTSPIWVKAGTTIYFGVVGASELFLLMS